MVRRVVCAGLMAFLAAAAPARGDDGAAAVAALEKVGATVDPDRAEVDFWLNPKLSDADLAAAAAHLRRLPRLRVLMLDFTGVTDAGLKHLAGLPKLEVVTLRLTGVTDAGLKTLEGLPGLQVVAVNLTGVTPRGAAAFEKARPGVKVEASGPGEPAAEAAKLRGRWRATKVESDGKSDPNAKDRTLVVDGNDLVLLNKGRLIYLCRFTLDPTAQPKGGSCQITAATPGFNSRTDRFGFAYKVDGDTLTLCLGSTDRPDERPRELSGKAGNLYVFEREKGASGGAK